MSDVDVFETRFAAAYRRYLDEVPTGVDAAAVARTVAAARPAAWPWALRPTRALVWLALLGLLLVALGAAAFLVGSHRSPLGFTCPAGTNPNQPGPVGQARPPSAFTGIAFDRDAGKLVVTAGTDAAAPRETWAFDVCTNRWTRMHPAVEPAIIRLVQDADAHLAIGIDETGAVWAYDLATNNWTWKGTGPWKEVPGGGVRLVYDPGSGLMLAALPADPPQLWAYDVEGNTWGRIGRQDAPQPFGPWDARFITYDPSVGRIIAYVADCGDCTGGDRTILTDPRTGTWSQAAAVTPSIYRSYYEPDSEIAYDESTKLTVMFGFLKPTTGVVVEGYDATADRWETLYTADTARVSSGPGDRLHDWMVYDPVNERIVMAGGDRRTSSGWVPADDVWAFDTTTRQWTQLLPLSTP